MPIKKATKIAVNVLASSRFRRPVHPKTKVVALPAPTSSLSLGTEVAVSLSYLWGWGHITRKGWIVGNEALRLAEKQISIVLDTTEYKLIRAYKRSLITLIHTLVTKYVTRLTIFVTKKNHPKVVSNLTQ